MVRFRKQALDQLTVEDELDALPRLINVNVWSALLILYAFILCFLLWLYFGQIPRTVDSLGIIITRQGLNSIHSIYSGEISEVLVNNNEFVKQGQLIAILRQPDLEDQFNTAQKQLETLKSDLFRKEYYGKENLELRQSQRTIDRMKLHLSIEDQVFYNNWLVEKTRFQKTLWEKGLATKTDYINYKNQLLQGRSDLKNLYSQLEQLDIDDSQDVANFVNDVADAQLAVEAQQLTVEDMYLEILRKKNLASRFTGNIQALTIQPGLNIAENQQVAQIRRNDDTIELIVKLYVDPNDGPKVKVGSRVALMPFSVETSEYGNLEGFVTEVSLFPVTADAINLTMNNETLVQNLTANGSPYEVTVCLLPDPTTFSGLQWSGGKGSPIKIKNGVLTSGRITVERSKPYEFIMPFIRKNFLGIDTIDWLKANN